MTFDELVKWLYKIGTGWLGWNPADTRSAHMQEIILAYEGHIDKLKAIHGSSEKTPSKGSATKKEVTLGNLNDILGFKE